jgi:hypothetical protein
MGIFERIGALAGTELSKATNLAHETFGQRMGEHGHTGRALIESIAQVCRNHPNLVGIAVGFLVEQLLVHERHRYEALHGPGSTELTPGTNTAVIPAAPVAPPAPHEIKHAQTPHHHLRFANLKPGKIAWEVFGGLILLKLAATGVKIFRHKHQGEAWFAPIAKIHLFSGTIAAYYFAKSLKSPKLSAWRNAAIALFATDAIKPVLKIDKKRARAIAAQKLAAEKAAAQQAAAAQKAAAQQQAAAPIYVQPAPQPAPQPVPQPEPAPIQPAPEAPAETYQKAASAEPDPAIGQGRVLQAVNIGTPPANSPFSIVPPPQPVQPEPPTAH